MKHDLKTNNFERKVTRVYAILACTAMVMMVTAVPALAADDPLTVVNNLSEFIFSLIRAIGLILLGFGILQVGLSLKSHDPSQRANGMLTVAGGIVITFTKEILTLSPVENRIRGAAFRLLPLFLPAGGDFEWEVETGSLTT